MLKIGLGLLVGWLIWGWVGLRITHEADGWYVHYSLSKGVRNKKKIF